jgi:hypothetical protein
MWWLNLMQKEHTITAFRQFLDARAATFGEALPWLV